MQRKKARKEFSRKEMEQNLEVGSQPMSLVLLFLRSRCVLRLCNKILCIIPNFHFQVTLNDLLVHTSKQRVWGRKLNSFQNLEHLESVTCHSFWVLIL